jgi:hypothetical protein
MSNKETTLEIVNMENMNKNKNITRATTGDREAVLLPYINYNRDKNISETGHFDDLLA